MTEVRCSVCTGCGRVLSDPSETYDIVVRDRAVGRTEVIGTCCPRCVGRARGFMGHGMRVAVLKAREKRRAKEDLEWRFVTRYRGVR